MKLHVFVLQVNGDVTARQEYDSRKALGDPHARQLIQEYSELLEKQFAGNPEKRGKFQFPTSETAHYRWTWQQFNPLSALCVIEIAGKPIGACVFLYGFGASKRTGASKRDRSKYDDCRKNATATRPTSWRPSRTPRA